jgi:DNA-binding NtrC family response regulator
MSTVLVAWIGMTDLRAPLESAEVGLGPIAQAIDARTFDEALLLSDFPVSRVQPYLKWLSARTKTRVRVVPEKLSGPTNFGEIYEAAVRACEDAQDKASGDTTLVFHLSPGTPAMAAVWIILAKTRFPAELIESSKGHGVRTASVPFDISADFLPDLLRASDERVRAASAAEPPAAPEFADIVHRSPIMVRLIARARRVAVRTVPVLIEGESGTGKELLARAIHQSSPRRGRRFEPVNCGAIPAELVESALFGHERGAFTGADRRQVGHFEAASGGTLFLDEVGELPLAAQVKLLRALQEGEIVRLGGTEPIKVDVRVVAATNRTLTDEIAAGRFREDLFYRLAVAVLKLPPLRERAGDVSLLLQTLWERVRGDEEVGAAQRELSAAARNVLLGHRWPGNVRELANTLQRAALWSDGQTVSADAAREALLPAVGGSRSDVLGRPLGPGLDLPELLAEVARHYLARAVQEAAGNKTQAAELVGLASYQTFSNWLDRYGVSREVNRGRKSG